MGLHTAMPNRSANYPRLANNSPYGLPVSVLDQIRVIRIDNVVQSVIETNAYLAAAKDAGMSVDEQQAVVNLVAADPQVGEIMPGCGGARKLRVARPGGGKSGGYRIITY